MVPLFLHTNLPCLVSQKGRFGQGILAKDPSTWDIQSMPVIHPHFQLSMLTGDHGGILAHSISRRTFFSLFSNVAWLVCRSGDALEALMDHGRKISLERLNAVEVSGQFLNEHLSQARQVLYVLAS